MAQLEPAKRGRVYVSNLAKLGGASPIMTQKQKKIKGKYDEWRVQGKYHENIINKLIKC